MQHGRWLDSTHPAMLRDAVLLFNLPAGRQVSYTAQVSDTPKLNACIVAGYKNYHTEHKTRHQIFP